jgi:hypothetical protein
MKLLLTPLWQIAPPITSVWAVAFECHVAAKYSPKNDSWNSLFFIGPKIVRQGIFLTSRHTWVRIRVMSMESAHHDPSSHAWRIPQIYRHAAIAGVLLRCSVLRDSLKPSFFVHVYPTALLRPGILMSVRFPSVIEYVSNGGTAGKYFVNGRRTRKTSW